MQKSPDPPAESAAADAVVLPAPPDLYVLTHQVHDMSETAARAVERVAKYTHAVPARHETLRVGIYVAAIGCAATFVGWLAFRAIESGQWDRAETLLWVFTLIVGLLGAGPIIDAVLKRLRASTPP